MSMAGLRRFYSSVVSRINSREYAQSLDQKDPLRRLRDEFIIPTRADLRRTLQSQQEKVASKPSTYLCGNSLGVQPKCASTYVSAQLKSWATKGVYGHFKAARDSLIPPWIHIDEAVTHETAKIVGARSSEVAVMQTLTANLHLLMTSFYRPTKQRFKIMLETKAFPSDHYVVESQLRHHSVDPAEGMITIEPPKETAPLLPTDHILSLIDEHAASTAVLLLPGVQFYTGQLFDIRLITAYAQSKGIVVGWDLAHAVGNVPLSLHDHNVDFAAWCTYKYMNCGPGAAGGLFIHSRHTDVSEAAASKSARSTSSPAASQPHPEYLHRLAGWWGHDTSTRFAMTNQFLPIPGARGFQLSNPSAIDFSSILASLSIFSQTDIGSLRRKSVELTGYLEALLLEEPRGAYKIITPGDPQQRGAQLSLLLGEGLLDGVMEVLEEEGVVVDERKPDVVRVAPAPLYNSFEDVWRFVQVFKEACERAKAEAKMRSV